LTPNQRVLDMLFESGAFDAAYMLHVGMNIADKRQLCADVHRVLRPGACFGIYDLMRTGAGELEYPVPWASVPEISAVASPDD
jgi:ubiquinone/menaquinone biosynthesis C-methylase UbiE